jgi:hypothetical protein
VKSALALLAVLACPACEQLFGLQHLDPPIDAKEIDAPRACEDPTPFGSECRTVMLPITNDTFITEASSDTPFGSYDALKISGLTPALLKFDTSQIAADERIASMTLTIDPKYAQGAKACSNDNLTCMTCPTPALGAWQIRWMRTDWNEAEATWSSPSAGATWSMPGASAEPDDRSAVVASGAPPVGGGSMVMPITSEQLLEHSPNCYRTESQLALMLAIEGLAYFDTKEGTVCTDGPEIPALLDVTLCRDAL